MESLAGPPSSCPTAQLIVKSEQHIFIDNDVDNSQDSVRIITAPFSFDRSWTSSCVRIFRGNNPQRVAGRRATQANWKLPRSKTEYSRLLKWSLSNLGSWCSACLCCLAANTAASRSKASFSFFSVSFFSASSASFSALICCSSRGRGPCQCGENVLKCVDKCFSLTGSILHVSEFTWRGVPSASEFICLLFSLFFCL